MTAPVAGPFAGPVLGAGSARFELDAARQPFLDHHRVGGVPLLSTVMGIEAIGCAASLADGPAGAADRVVTELRDVRVHRPFLLRDGDRGAVEVRWSGGRDALRCKVFGVKPSSGPEPHFEATVLLDAGLPPAPAPAVVPERRADHPRVDAGAVYRLYFHGPSFRVIGSAYRSGGLTIGVLAQGIPPIAVPAGPSATAPLLVELCLQTAGLAELAATGRMAIPDRIDRVVRRSGLEAHSGTPLRAVVTPRTDADGGAAFDALVVGDDGAVHLAVEGYRTVEFAHPPDAAALAPVLAALTRR